MQQGAECRKLLKVAENGGICCCCWKKTRVVKGQELISCFQGDNTSCLCKVFAIAIHNKMINQLPYHVNQGIMIDAHGNLVYTT